MPDKGIWNKGVWKRCLKSIFYFSAGAHLYWRGQGSYSATCLYISYYSIIITKERCWNFFSYSLLFPF
jgi:hypothetical protein